MFPNTCSQPALWSAPSRLQIHHPSSFSLFSDRLLFLPSIPVRELFIFFAM
eukprot:m.193881 g.193881  ORF g.193881 m.193881 type:complete len:51 (+) comp15444_c1_seq1:3264-3416(+)